MKGVMNDEWMDVWMDGRRGWMEMEEGSFGEPSHLHPSSPAREIHANTCVCTFVCSLLTEMPTHENTALTISIRTVVSLRQTHKCVLQQYVIARMHVVLRMEPGDCSGRHRNHFIVKCFICGPFFNRTPSTSAASSYISI